MKTRRVLAILRLAVVAGALLAVATVVVPESTRAEETTFTCPMMQGSFGWTSCSGADTCPGEFWEKGSYCDATCKTIDPKTKTAQTSGTINCNPM